jgi:hypothetical protein
MDGFRFDSLARSLATASSRRRALGGLLAGALGLVGWPGGEDAAAHDLKAKCKKKSGEAKKKCLKKAKQHAAAHASEPPPPPPPPPPPLPPPPTGPTCSDNVKNGTESDVDCGGTCPRCPNARRCTGPNDCASAYCTSGACQFCPTLGAACGSDGSTTCTCQNRGTSDERFCINPGKIRGSCGPGGTCPSNEVCVGGGNISPICIALCGAP